MGSGPNASDPPNLRDGDPVAALLDAWQASAAPEQLESLVAVVRPLVEGVARRELARCRVGDRSAVEDVVTLVLDHIRRLPRGHGRERQVAMFRGAEFRAGRGIAFIRFLARNRAIDVVRSRRRRSRHMRAFSALDEAARRTLLCGDVARRNVNETDLHDSLVEAVSHLEPPLRIVVELLLEGKSQAVIAHILDVCEGTVSRMRQRAVSRLRDLLDE